MYKVIFESKFENWKESKTDIRQIDTAGCKEAVLISDGHLPKLSPDMEHILFYRYENEHSKIKLANSNGKKEKDLGFGSDPSWSSDGKLIVFVNYDEITARYNTNIYIMNTDGSNRKKLTRTPHGYCLPSFTNKNDRIVFFGGYDGIFISDIDGNNIKKILEKGCYHPTCSPVTDQLLFCRKDTIFIANLDGSNEKELGPGQCPIWFPDGKKIAFSLGEPDKEQIYIMNKDGSERIQLTNNMYKNTWTSIIMKNKGTEGKGFFAKLFG